MLIKDLYSAFEITQCLLLRGLSLLEPVPQYRLIASCTVDFGIFSWLQLHVQNSCHG